MLSRGVPMILAGDEIQRTQAGNNNAYNQDNATSWFDWSLAASHRDVLRYVQRMIAFRKARAALRQPRFYSGAVNDRGLPDLTWHGTRLGSPGFDDSEGRALACSIAGFDGDADLHVMMNMFWEPLDFEVPVNTQRDWLVAVDTFAPEPLDIPDADQRPQVSGPLRTVQARSIVILLGATAAR